MNYIYEGQTLVLPCYVLSTIYYQLLLLEIVVDDEIVDESINELVIYVFHIFRSQFHGYSKHPIQTVGTCTSLVLLVNVQYFSFICILVSD